MSVLDEILGTAALPEEEPPLPIPSTVRIGDGALDKAQRICDLVKKIHGISMEWYGFMISKKDRPDTVIDIVIGHQESNAAHTQMDGASISEVSHRVQTSMPDSLITGWIHSHANFGTIFSETDQNNMETVLNSVYLNTRTPTRVPYQLIEGEMNITYDQAGKLATISGSLDTDMHVQVQGIPVRNYNNLAIRMLQPVLVGWSYSLVVNEKGNRSGHVNCKKEYPLDKHVELWNYPAPVEVVNGIALQIDDTSLENELRQYVKRPVRPTIIRYVGRRGRRTPIFSADEFFSITFSGHDETGDNLSLIHI